METLTVSVNEPLVGLFFSTISVFITTLVYVVEIFLLAYLYLNWEYVVELLLWAHFTGSSLSRPLILVPLKPLVDVIFGWPPSFCGQNNYHTSSYKMGEGEAASFPSRKIIKTCVDTFPWSPLQKENVTRNLDRNFWGITKHSNLSPTTEVQTVLKHTLSKRQSDELSAQIDCIQWMEIFVLDTVATSASFGAEAEVNIFLSFFRPHIELVMQKISNDSFGVVNTVLFWLTSIEQVFRWATT